MNIQQEITNRFRKVAWGRLYWKKANKGRWRDFFDSDDVAVVYDAPLSIHYKTMNALLEDIMDAELDAKNKERVWNTVQSRHL